MSAVLPPASAALLQTLQQWVAQRWLRPLDQAFAAFLAELDPAASPELLLGAALLSQLEGQGHTALPLDTLLHEPDALLGWPLPGRQACRAQLRALGLSPEHWVSALRASPLVAHDALLQAGTAALAQSTLLGLTALAASDAPVASAASDASTASAASATHAAHANTPLVLRGTLLAFRRHWHDEREVAQQVLLRGAPTLQRPSEAVRAWMRLLFPPAAPNGERTAPATGHTADTTDWQQVACALALRGRLSVITGGPGTGKTFTAARLLVLLLATAPAPQQLRLALAAPTGKAAARLGQSIATALQQLQPVLQAHDPALASLLQQLPAARTLHALLGARPDTRAFQANASRPLPLDLLVVDEASMVNLEMMAALLRALPPAAHLVLLGDKDQLASVEAGAVLGDLCRDAEAGRYDAATVAYLRETTGQQLPTAVQGQGPPLAQQTVMLRRSHRFGGPIGQLAQAANAGQVELALQLLGGGGPVAWVDAATPQAAVQLAVHGRSAAPADAAFTAADTAAVASGHEAAAGGHASPGGFARLLQARPMATGDAAADRAAFDAWALALLTAFDRCRVLCAVREGPWGAAALNAAIERALAVEGLLQRQGAWYEGRPVMVTRNDRALGVFNGDVGLVLRPPAVAGGSTPPALRVVFADGQRLRWVAASRLAHVETAFAMTVHKSQGSEFAHTVLVLPAEPSRVLTRELVYTGITRARQAFTLVTGRRQALADALAQRTLRASGLPGRLDAGQAAG